MWKWLRVIRFGFSGLLIICVLFYGWPPPRRVEASPGTRVRTVEFFGGQYESTTAADENTQNNFTAQTFSLAENSADIIDAYVEVSAQIGSITPTTYLSSYIYFDASDSTPSPAAYTTTASLGNTASASQTILFRANVTSEGDIAAYTGGGTSKNFQIGYCFATGASCSGTLTPNIQAANAKLVITYTYDDTSSTQTNTVIYPLESASETGSKTASQASCTIDSNCPTFSYNATIPEISSQLSQWFYFQGGFDVPSTGGNVTTQSDIGGNPGGTNTTGVSFGIDNRNNGGWHNWSLSGVGDYANNSSQSIEVSTNATAITALGGENYVTYTYANNAATKTRTIILPVGELITSNGSTSKSALTGSTVYFPESGVDVKKAWFRVHASRNANSASAGSLAVTAKIGTRSETATTTYSIAADGVDVSDGGYLIHLIPSAEYGELEAATASSGTSVQVAAQWTANAGGAVSAELVITYTYTSEAYGYLVTQNLFAGQQTASAATSYTTSTGAINPKIAETVGIRTIRGASLRMSAKNTGTTANEDLGANLTTSTCSASNTSTAQTGTRMTRVMLWKNVTGAVTTNDSTTYTACYSSAEASIFTGILVVTYQWDDTPYVEIESSDTQPATVTVGSSSNYMGTITATSDGTLTSVNSIVITETGTIDANADLTIVLKYEKDGDCSYANGGSINFSSSIGFGVDDKANVSGAISGGFNNQACFYLLLTVGAGASAGETIELEISNPSNDVTIQIGSASPMTTVAIDGTTTVVGSTPILTFSVSDSAIGFGTLSSSAARYATGDGTGSASETEAHNLVASTTATNGYTITVNGTTLTSGANTISAIGPSNTASSVGSEQFGIRLTASGGSGTVSAPYAASGFAFDTAAFPDEIASATGSSADTTYSVRYLANIAATTEAGTYGATLTYVVTGNF